MYFLITEGYRGISRRLENEKRQKLALNEALLCGLTEPLVADLQLLSIKLGFVAHNLTRYLRSCGGIDYSLMSDINTRYAYGDIR